VLGIAEGAEALAVPLEQLSASAQDGWAVAGVEVGGEELAVFWKRGTSSALDSGIIAEGRDVGAATAYVPRANGTTLSFVLRQGGIVDEQTGSRWSISGAAVEGELEGTQLDVGVAIPSFWFDWAAFHPQTEVWEAA
jgi:hypothetical protein